MKFYCGTTEMTNGLSIVTRALPQKTPNLILENILIQTAEDAVIFTCSNERLSVRTRITARVEEHGAGLLPGKLFGEIARRLPMGEVCISTNDKNAFRILAGGSRTNVMGQLPDQYPDMPSFQEGKDLTLPQSVLKEMIAKTEFAVATDEVREVLTGAYVETDGDEIHMVALDGFRMAVITRRPGCDCGRMKAILPGKVIADLGKLLSDDPDEMVQLRFSENRLQVVLGETQIYAVLIDGEFVNYRQIIPKDFKTHVVMNVDEIRQGIARVSLMAREANSNLVSFEIKPEGTSLQSHSEIGDTLEEFPSELIGEPIKVSFNVNYISDILKTIDGERVEFCLNSPITPCIVRPVGEDEYFHLVLPIRT